MTQPFHLLPRIGSSLAEEWLDIGLNHQLAGRQGEAEQAYSKGLRIDPSHGPCINNLAILAAQQSNVLVATQRFERALIFDDKNATIWYNYALCLLEAERADEALPAIKQSLKLAESAAALCAQGMILTSLAKAAEAVEVYDAALVKEPNQGMAAFNAIFARTLKNTTPADNYAARKRWHEHFRWQGVLRSHPNDRQPDRKLRIGYVGGDFKMHSAFFFFGKIVLGHNRDLFDPYCYMSMPPDATRDQTTKQFTEKTSFRDISAITDDAAEAMIHEDKIDILVDLAGHTGGNRLALFTRKPAPVQVHAWGFAHGSGCPEIDYFFADPYAVPEAERQYFAEKIWDLPAVVGYMPPEYHQVGVSPPPVDRDGTFTFGVFGRFEKYSPQSLEAWHKIMLQVPGSRLVIKDLTMRRPHVIKYLHKVFHDIDPKRLVFMQDCSHTDQMLTYQNVDLVLDTFPHTGGVTAMEILYMGVPIVTLYNGQVGGRTTAVALRAIGRQGWVANSINEYVQKAVKLSADRSQLAEARKVLRDQLLKSPLCTGYTEAVENAYRSMWWRYCGHEAKPEQLKQVAQ